MNKVSGQWLTNPATQDVASMFIDTGYQVFFVGGCVRNALLNVSVSDIDMATDALPETVLQLGKDAGFKTIPTGIDHGTVTVVSGGIAHEITTFRTDVATDGRHADVAFSNDITQDARRRDFTMNALYADPNGTVHDPVCGLPDLQARKVKFVGEPHERIAEDYLRILRFFRFHAWYGDADAGLDVESLAACADGIEGLKQLSRERIGAEMIKLLSADNPAPSIASMSHSGVLQSVMPGVDPKALAPLIHFEDARAPDWRRRAAVLSGKDLKDEWRLAKKDVLHLNQLRQALADLTAIPELSYRYGATMALNTALARSALFETPLAHTVETEIELGANATFPIKAADLPKLEGRDLGEKLRALESVWIQSGFTISKADLLAL